MPFVTYYWSISISIYSIIWKNILVNNNLITVIYSDYITFDNYFKVGSSGKTNL